MNITRINVRTGLSKGMLLLIALVGTLGATTQTTQAQSTPAGMTPYFTRNSNTAKKMPPDPAWETNLDDTYYIYGGETVWIAFENQDYDPNASKTATLTLTWVQDPSDPNDTPLTKITPTKERVGFKNGDESASNKPIPSSLQWYGGTSGPNSYTLNISFKSCVKWERFKFFHKGTANQITTFKAHLTSSCWTKGSATGDGDDEDDDGLTDETEFKIQGGKFGALTGMNGNMQITEIEIFPTTLQLDIGATQTFEAPIASGDWFSEFVFDDPLGNPRPQAGIRWFTNGPGITNEDIYNLSISTHDTADRNYEMFIFDIDVNEYGHLVFHNNKLPWYMDFETYDLEDNVSNQGFWKGWDSDPAFDAPITDALAHSGLLSVDVKEEVDVVREFDLADSGLWSFSAWQYIPADFESGGNGNFDGSYFILLNTYQDGGPYNWSVQIQFDSNDNLMKVFHGEGLDQIEIPYIVDQWVKIEVIVDLDNDSTQIFYNNNLITEYSWTAGSLGDGGGVAAIAAVDLYAKGSSSISYDDMSLVPIPLPIPPCPADLNGDGTVNTSDLLLLFAAWGTNPGGPPDLDGDGTVSISDLLILFGDWGPCP